MPELIVESFSGGLNTDTDPARLSLNEATVAQDIDIRDGLGRKLPGQDNKFDSLPASLIFKSAVEALFTQPSEQQITLVHGTVSGAEKLYVRPYLDLAGAWVDAWREITEREGTQAVPLVMDASSNTTTIVDAALSSSANDYYNQWIVYNKTRSLAGLVRSYVGATKTITLKWAIASQTNGDDYWLVRFPIWRIGQTTGLFQPDNYARFRVRENAIEILTGNQTGYPSASDLILLYVNRSMLDDSDLDFNSLLCEPNQLDFLNSTDFVTLSEINETDDPLDQDSWIVINVPVYDGFQEGAFNPGISPSKLAWDSGSTIITLADATAKIRISYSFFPADNASPRHFRTSTGIINGSEARLYWSRRITHFDVYLAQADLLSTGANSYVPTSEFRRVRRVAVDDSSWSGTGPYTRTVDITASDWSNAVGETPEFRRGHKNLAIHATAEFAKFVGRHLFLGSVFIDKQRTDIILRTPINSDDLNTPDVKAQNLFLKTSTYGIPRIMGMVESLGRLIVLGETSLLRIIPTVIGEPQVEEVPINKGPVSKKGVIEANGIIYFAAHEGIFAFNLTNIVKESDLVNISDRGGKGGIRQEWQALSEANRQGTIAGYDRNKNCILFSAGGTNYVFWIDRGAWTTFTGINTPQWFFTGIDGELIILTSSGNDEMANVFGSSPDVATQWIWQGGVMEGPIRTKRIRVPFKGTDNMTAKFYDAQESATVQRLPDKILQSNSLTIRRGAEASGLFKRLQVRVQSASSTNSDNEIERIEIEADRLNKK